MLLSINPDAPLNKDIETVADVLREGGVIAYPTDTTYGLGASILKSDAIERIVRVKERMTFKPFSFICCDLHAVMQYAIVDKKSYAVMKKFLPGPYTFILEAKQALPWLTEENGRTVGIRIPDNKFCLALVQKLGAPIITTSANITDKAVLTTSQEIMHQMGDKIDIVVDGGVIVSLPSTVIDLSKENPIVLREGKGDSTCFS